MPKIWSEPDPDEAASGDAGEELPIGEMPTFSAVGSDEPGTTAPSEEEEDDLDEL